MKMNLDEQKLLRLKDSDKVFDKYYGEIGSVKRTDFEAKAKAWYYAELLKEVRKKERVTQQELAKKIGKKREYIALLEKGETDMQLSTFISITEALGLRLSIV
ncbi:MAG: helix-turn-helix domain-containing protein [Prevotellaceae bacterium]|jgi:DNA-binding XRE family transcriptional regulator|nr:helix-turn-helix domain-containing protein [Prevotellaceae bacterium]